MIHLLIRVAAFCQADHAPIPKLVLGFSCQNQASMMIAGIMLPPFHLLQQDWRSCKKSENVFLCDSGESRNPVPLQRDSIRIYVWNFSAICGESENPKHEIRNNIE